MPMRVTEPIVTCAPELSPESDPVPARDWSGWEKWLRAHLDIEREAIVEEYIQTVGKALGVKSAQLRAEIKQLELQLDELKTELRNLPPARAPRMRGTFNPNTEYGQLDVVALNGSSFIALRDAPGACPGANWQLVASCGRRGPKGERGEHGRVATIVSWQIDTPTSQRRSWMMAVKARTAAAARAVPPRPPGHRARSPNREPRRGARNSTQAVA